MLFPAETVRDCGPVSGDEAAAGTWGSGPMKKRSGQRVHPDDWHQNNRHLSVALRHTPFYKCTHTSAGVSASCLRARAANRPGIIAPNVLLPAQTQRPHTHLSLTRNNYCKLDFVVNKLFTLKSSPCP